MRAGPKRRGCRVGVQLGVFNQKRRREKIPELTGTFGSPCQKLAHGRPRAATHPVEEFLGQRLQCVAAVVEVGS